MPPTSSSPSSLARSLFLSLSHLHFKEPESCVGTRPPYHLCTISTGTPFAQPRWTWCSFLSPHLSTPLWKPLALLSQKGWRPWIRSLQNRCSNTKLLKHKRVLYTLSPYGDCSDVDVVQERNCRGNVCSMKLFLVHSAWASIRNEEWASVSPLSFMNHQMLYFMNMDLVFVFLVR